MKTEIQHYQDKLSFEMDTSDLFGALEAKENVIVLGVRKGFTFDKKYISWAINLPHRIMKQKIKLSIFVMMLLFLVKPAIAKPLGDTSGIAVIHAYVHSFIHSNAKELARALDDDAVMKMPRFTKVIAQTKDELVHAYQVNEATTQECASETVMLSSSDAIIVALVKFKYLEFDEEIYLIVERKNEKWKITQIIKMFHDKEAPKNTTGILSAK